MDGNIQGNTATTTVKIQVTDINDNKPTLEKDEVERFFFSPHSHYKSVAKKGWDFVKKEYMLVEQSMLLYSMTTMLNR